MRNPVLEANFSMFNLLNTIAYAVVIFCLFMSIVRCMKHEKKPCKWSCLCKFVVMLAFALLIVSQWVSLPTTG